MASHVILDDTILDALPYYIIEQLKPDYSGSIQPEILPVARRRHIVAVHAIRFSSSGCYIGKFLGRHPHYSVPASDYDRLITGPCHRFGIDLKQYSNKKSISSSSIVTVFNMDNGDLGRIGELVREITAVDESSPTRYDSLPDNAQRGARQKHYGFSTSATAAAAAAAPTTQCLIFRILLLGLRLNASVNERFGNVRIRLWVVLVMPNQL